MYVYDFEGATQPGMITVTGTRPWTRYELAFRTADDGEGRLNVRLFRATGRAWFDDVQLRRGRHVSPMVFRRAYEKGLVLVRPTEAGDYGDETAVRVDLPAAGRPVDAAGGAGPPVTSLWLREGEAAILVR